KNALRQRPDVILVGEIRDREVMEQALAASETGHLCLATIHTSNSYQAVERIINFFPEDHADQIRLNLSANLKAIISQRLIPSIDGGMVPAIEVLLNQGLVRELILKGEVSKIKEVMEKNTTLGMCSFDQSFLDLYTQGLVSEETVLSHADKLVDLKVKIQQLKLSKKSTSKGETLKGLDTSVISFKD
ncbi:MAG: ATPase, T2SS/T4P/T4SS family, partial [Alphaproteobacteria bacterium]